MFDPTQAYDRMLLIRRFEEAVEKLFSEGRIMGTAHTCIGQEATAVGVAAALQPQDALTSTHRGHGHFLARGADPGRLMAELFGRATGYSRGRGGSQMMMEPALGFYGTNGITGASVAFAAGLALQAQLAGTDRVVVAFFGDGASSQGVIHESLNLAALWKLPLIAVCESNGYAMSTPASCGVSVDSVATRAVAYGITGATVDGNDPRAVHDAIAALADRGRKGGGPALLECRTYRLSGHSRGDRREYRTRDEEQAAWRQEPLTRIEQALTAAGTLDAAALERHRAAAERRVAEAIAFAEASPMPDEDTVAEGVFA
ncbi:MAG: thiamine pyrophosphate-dependent dehydrogenase E1 component subunit alpha [Lentisphaerae bacterium]|nr:thiamine pyrophosphate-dependent dehydrogenase E1 component subunit alpha [Lentisphaerota bacterium]